MHHVRRRDFIALLGSTATIWPRAVWAQQPANMPVVALVNARKADAATALTAEFRKGLSQTGLIEGRDLAVEYHWLDGHYEQLPAIISDSVSHHVAVIATPASTPGSPRPRPPLRPFRLCSAWVRIRWRSDWQRT